MTPLGGRDQKKTKEELHCPAELHLCFCYLDVHTVSGFFWNLPDVGGQMEHAALAVAFAALNVELLPLSRAADAWQLAV